MRRIKDCQRDLMCTCKNVCTVLWPQVHCPLVYKQLSYREETILTCTLHFFCIFLIGPMVNKWCSVYMCFMKFVLSRTCICNSFTLPSISFQIHWFSIFNSFMMVIFLVGLVSMILMRTLRKDYARYSKDDELDDMVRKFLTLSVWIPKWKLFNAPCQMACHMTGCGKNNIMQKFYM